MIGGRFQTSFLHTTLLHTTFSLTTLAAASAALTMTACEQNDSPRETGRGRDAPGLTQSPTRDTVERSIGDEQIRLAIETEYMLAHEISEQSLDVHVQRGIVTLAGVVDDLRAQEAAIDTARRTRGVRAIVDRMEVAPSYRKDEGVAREVREALLSHPATELFEIDVAVDDGEVTLTGAVESWQEKRVAEDVAAGVRGVRETHNDIQVDYRAARSDAEIAEDVRTKLANDVRIPEALIDVSVDDGVVELSGEVGSAYEKNLAVGKAYVLGTERVLSEDLEVDPWMDDPMTRDEVAVVPDHAIQAAVEDALFYDARVFSGTPEVNVSYGKVTLTGTVKSLAAKQAAGETAHNTVGVWRVVNLLKVRDSAGLKPEEIESRLAQAFNRDTSLWRYDIDIEVINGRAFLTGAVPWPHLRARAAEIAAETKGVKAVDNGITVTRTPHPVSDYRIEDDVQMQLGWNVYTDVDDIEVDVQGGVVTLTGEVATDYERRQALEEARQGGARVVVDMLEVAGRSS